MLKRPQSIDSDLERLLAQFGAQVRALVSIHCRAEQGVDPDDVEQEVRIRLWRALERDRSAVLGASYIQRVVVSTVIDAVRRAEVRPAESLSDETVALAAERAETSPGPDARSADVVQIEAIMACLAEVPVRRQRAIELHLLGYALEEIGVLCGVSAEASRKLVSRGMEEFRAVLRQKGLGEFYD